MIYLTFRVNARVDTSPLDRVGPRRASRTRPDLTTPKAASGVGTGHRRARERGATPREGRRTMSRVQPSRAYDALYGASFFERRAPASSVAPLRVDSPDPTLPLHSPARADPLWTQSGARDFYRDQARASGRRVESIPVSTNYFAEGANFPSHELRCVARLPFPSKSATRAPSPSQFGPPLVSAPRTPIPPPPARGLTHSPSPTQLVSDPSARPSPRAATSRASSAPR
jgi:hypothetical protein